MDNPNIIIESSNLKHIIVFEILDPCDYPDIYILGEIDSRPVYKDGKVNSYASLDEKIFHIDAVGNRRETKNPLENIINTHLSYRSFHPIKFYLYNIKTKEYLHKFEFTHHEIKIDYFLTNNFFITNNCPIIDNNNFPKTNYIIYDQKTKCFVVIDCIKSNSQNLNTFIKYDIHYTIKFYKIVNKSKIELEMLKKIDIISNSEQLNKSKVINTLNSIPFFRDVLIIFKNNNIIFTLEDIHIINIERMENKIFKNSYLLNLANSINSMSFNSQHYLCPIINNIFMFELIENSKKHLIMYDLYKNKIIVKYQSDNYNLLPVIDKKYDYNLVGHDLLHNKINHEFSKIYYNIVDLEKKKTLLVKIL